MDQGRFTSEIEPLSLAKAPSFIERMWPAQKLSAEAQKERKAGAGQTLTALGSYWKGRKPLILVRASVLACLMPATDDPETDLAVFEKLMAIDDEAFLKRLDVTPSNVATWLTRNGITEADVARYFSARAVKGTTTATDSLSVLADKRRLSWRSDLAPELRQAVERDYIAAIPYHQRVIQARRPEEVAIALSDEDWLFINRHLGTRAHSLQEVVNQLGIMRFGHRPRVGDAFAGGGSIPFEAARMGCDVYAGDLNPIACMLNWGAVNVVGASEEQRERISALKRTVVEGVNAELIGLGVETDKSGNRAKSYLYCLETRCPQSGWMVPMLPSLVISKTRNVIARLIPDEVGKRYNITVEEGAARDEMVAAEQGTVRDGYLIHTVNGETYSTSVKSIRGDYRDGAGNSMNRLRPWTKTDFAPRAEDIFQERLYCIQWITAAAIDRGRPETFFAAPTSDDAEREARVVAIVAKNLGDWQAAGLVPNQPIESGEKTDEPIRTRGWTHWHHLFSPRQLLVLSTLKRYAQQFPETYLDVAKALDRASKLCRWTPGSPGKPGVAPTAEKVSQVFDNQALNTFYNYAERSGYELLAYLGRYDRGSEEVRAEFTIVSGAARDTIIENDLFITDPPYADAVNYHEITEFFITWLRGNPPAPFERWVWDSRRPLAIKGDGDEFRREMVAAYSAMTEHMPENGLQVVMFTHQSGSVWADLAQIFWGAGLQVQAAWYIATETSSELKKGGYVQGTVILVLKKRPGAKAGYEDEIVQDVRDEVARQIDTLVGLNQSLKGTGRIENLFEDSDLQMAGYAAALRVLTGYTKIDGRDMTAEALRPRRKSEMGMVDRMIDYAVGVANEHMVPDGLSPRLWQQMKGSERFFLKMVDVEAGGQTKLDNYQNFARAFRVPDYTVFMASMRPNAARLKQATDFGSRSGFEIADFGSGIIRSLLYGIEALAREIEPDVVLIQLHDMVPDYFRRRSDMIEIAEYLARRRGRDDGEGRNAAVLANLLRNERL
ncbi:anti-phage-associated DUF1156 domain-containing protein [Rhizobium leguminosarum]|uniref:anti-phage-associated DUF1156 domain-containing protein n=1 Tax=Rhizobium leguminosarum TaxID=384 RepID=UPI001F16123A|nr:anti-phage-associated DUF1156 domain-containing protein [Rhizobium leguminosarum]UIJ83131.1 DUF1156 domain-containing protein [Rhizobium leguminosarum]